jgi:PKD repeat protein
MIVRWILFCAVCIPSLVQAIQFPGFIPQKVQLPSELGSPSAEVATWQGEGVRLGIYKDGYSLTFFHSLSPNAESKSLDKEFRGVLPSLNREAAQIRVRFPNGHAQRISWKNPTGMHINYDQTGDFQHNYQVEVFTDLVLHEVWPGIQVQFSFREGKVKYEFIVQAGADPSSISWDIEGQTEFELQKDYFQAGNQLGFFQDALGSIYTHNGAEVSGHLVQMGTRVQLVLGEFDPSQELVVDPGITWSTYYGSPDIESLTRLSVLSDGSVLACGFSNGASFPVLNSFQASLSGNFDGILVKLNAQGQPVWATYFGGAGEDRILDLAVSLNGDVLVCGETNASIPVSVGAYQSGNNGGRDAFIASFNPNGVRNWSTHFGGSSDDFGYAVAYDAQNKMYLSGGSYSSDLPVFNGYQQVKAGASNTMDGFLVQFSISGTPGWGTFLGGNLDDVVYSACTDPFGRVILTGATGSLNFPKLNTTLNFAGGTDIFLTQFNSFGQLQWSGFSGGSQTDVGLSVSCNPSGEIFLSGYSNSQNFPIQNAWQSQLGGSEDWVIQRYNGAGQLQWSTYWGGVDSERATCVTAPNSNCLLVGGYTEGSNFPVIQGNQLNSQGFDEGAYVLLDQTGNGKIASYLGGSQGDYIYGLGIISDTSFVLGGLTSSVDFPVQNAWQPSNAGSSQNPSTQDIFISRLCLSESRLSGTQTICIGSAILPVQFSGIGPWDLAYSDGIGTYSISGISSNPYLLIVSPSVTTTYTLVQAWDTQGCGAGLVYGSAVVSVQPFPPAANISGLDTLCPGSQGNIRFQFSGPGPWDFVYTDGTNSYTRTGISSSPWFETVQPTLSSTFSLVSIQSPCGIGTISGSAVLIVDVQATPSAQFSLNTISVCPGAQDSVAVVLNGSVPWSLTWSDGVQNYSASGISISPYFIPIQGNSGLNYQLSQVSNLCGSVTALDSFSILLLPLPQAGFTWVSDTFEVQFTNTSSDELSWQWSFGDAFFDSSANPLHTYLTAGSYFVRLIVANGCGLDTLEQMITVSIPPDTGTQVVSFWESENWKIYPNPNSSENLFLELSEGISPQEIQVLDKLGRPLFLPMHILREGLIRLELGSLSAGVYTVWVKESWGKRFIRLPVNP